MKKSNNKTHTQMNYRKIKNIFCIVVVMIIAIAIHTTEVKADEEIPSSAFGDATVYEYILSIADTNGDGVLMQSEAETIVTIDLQNKGITSIAGLEYCINAEDIYLSFNPELSDISPIAGMDKLKEVRIRNTAVKNISALMGKEQIQTLLMGDSGIDDISPLIGLSMLSQLEISNTQVTDISAISSIPSLTKLDVSGCKINDFSILSSITGLIYFYAIETSFSDLSVLESSASTLEVLGLETTKIVDISSLSKFTALKECNMYHNNISVCPDLSALVNLEVLKMNYNNISSIPGLSNLVNLKELNISMNKFTELPDISRLTKLEKFYCGHNLLTEIPNLSNCTVLTSFSITGNELTEESIANAEELMPESIKSAPDWKQNTGISTATEEETTTEEGEEETYREIVSDNGEDISISGDLDENVKMKGEKIDDITEYQHIVDIISKELPDIKDIEIYDIYLYEKGNNETIVMVQPNGTVEVKIKIQHNNYQYHVYRQEHDGKLVKLNSHVKDGYLYFESEHFSIFTVVMTELFGEENTSLHDTKDDNSEDVGEEEKDKEEKKEESNKLIYICIVVAVAVVAVVAIYEVGIYKGKKEKKAQEDLNDMMK